ncbi:MAG TPA: hypothetical protein VKH15_17450 [Candidatus Acidoferrum sp.]|nr:hypothetical protein [Candidatus Acidoferrum sp.]
MKRAWALCVTLAALWAGACSSGGTTVTTPPPNNGFSNNSLMGQYAFSMSGTDASSGVAVPFARVGSFTANGEGGIETGVEDVNLNLGQQGSNELGFTGGGYSINTDGRGTLSLIDSTGTLTFSITMTSANGGYLTNMPTDLMSAGSGSFVKQNPASFLLSAFSGSYAFDFSGADAQGNPESAVGQLVSTGNQVLSGFADDNDGGLVNGGTPGAATISGNYGPPTIASDLTNFGRGQITIGTLSGVFYIVGPNEVEFMETTSGGTLAGDALLQSNIPTTAAGIGGGFVYVMGGAGVTGVSGPLTRGGKFSASSGALSSIIVDNNNSGQSISLNTTSGTYTVDPSGDGRGTVTFSVSGFKDPFTYVFYLISPTQAVIQDQSTGIVEDGSMLAQGSGTISNTSLAGNYAINWSGVTGTGNGTGEEDLVGETSLTSGMFSGHIDVNEFATQSQATDVALSGTLQLAADPTSHNAVTLNLATNPAGQVTAFAYIANNNTILLMGTQKNRVVAGILTPQAP